MRAPEFWHGRGGAATLLRPAGMLYGLAGALRIAVGRPWRAPVPVVCVGNLTVGGTGKTPVAIDLARRLAERTPHLLTRGYGGKLAGPVRVDPKTHTVAEVGDEPLLLARVAPTWVARDRKAGARRAIAAGAGLLIMDDGFQNPSLAKDRSLLVVDGPAGFGNGLLFPAGPLREPAARGFARASALVMIGEDRHSIGRDAPLPVLRATLVPAMPLAFAPMAPVVAFAGIGRPEKFFATLAALGVTPLDHRAFPDHHVFAERELADLEALARGRGARLVTTEKDAVRLPLPWRSRVAVLRVAIEWEDPAALDRVLSGLAAG